MDTNSIISTLWSIVLTFGLGALEFFLAALFLYGILFAIARQMNGQYFLIFKRIEYQFSKYGLRVFLALVGFVVLYRLLGRVSERHFPIFVFFVFLAGVFRNLILDFGYGLICLINPSLQRGDTIRVGEFEGKVRDFDPLSLSIQLESGKFLRLPYSQVSKHGFVHIKKSELCFPVSVVIHQSQFPGIDHHMLRNIALTSAYRVAKQQPSVRYDPESSLYRVDFSTWDSKIVSAAHESFIEKLLEFQNNLIEKPSI